MSCPEPLPSRIPRQLRQRRVQAESVSPQLMDLVRPGTGASPDAREEREEMRIRVTVFRLTPGSPGNVSSCRCTRADGRPEDGTGEPPRAVSPWAFFQV